MSSYESLIGAALLGNSEDKAQAMVRVDAKLEASTRITCGGCQGILDQRTIQLLYQIPEAQNAEPILEFSCCPTCRDYYESRNALAKHSDKVYAWASWTKPTPATLSAEPKPAPKRSACPGLKIEADHWKRKGQDCRWIIMRDAVGESTNGLSVCRRFSTKAKAQQALFALANLCDWSGSVADIKAQVTGAQVRAAVYPFLSLDQQIRQDTCNNSGMRDSNNRVQFANNIIDRKDWH